MSRFLHFGLLGGCGVLVALFTPMAWQSAMVCELPVDCRGTFTVNPLAADLDPELEPDSEGLAVLDSVETS